MNEVKQPKRKTKYWSKKAPADTVWDTIVIGSGIGGMTTAALLAKLGQKVLVLEQHYVPGGFTHTFRRKGYSWDVGVHLVGETTERSLPGKVLSALTNGQLEWEPVGKVYDEFRFPDGFRIGFPDNPKAFRETLVEKFPDSAEEIDAYLAHVKETAKSMRGFFIDRALPGGVGRALGAWASRDAKKHLSVTAEETVNGLISDPKLRTVLNAQWGYHGSPPSEAAWALQALIVHHFKWGAYYPKGGADQIALHLLKTVADAGGWTRICADVEQILVENGKAVGVRMADGEEIRAPRVVSAAGAWTTVTKLLPAHLRDETWSRRVAQHAPAPAHLCLYLGFKGDTRAAGATPESQWYYNTWSHDKALWDVHPDRELAEPHILFTSFPSLKDPEHDPGPEQRQTGEIVTFVPWEPFQRWKDTRWRDRGEDYEAFKERMSQKMLEVLFRHNPDLEPMLDHYELATPLSTDLFCRPYKGSIYGLASTPDRFADPWLRCKSPVPGLFLSGSDVASCGIMGAMMGGFIAGVAIEPRRGVRWVYDLMRGR